MSIWNLERIGRSLLVLEPASAGRSRIALAALITLAVAAPLTCVSSGAVAKGQASAGGHVSGPNTPAKGPSMSPPAISKGPFGPSMSPPVISKGPFGPSMSPPVISKGPFGPSMSPPVISKGPFARSVNP